MLIVSFARTTEAFRDKSKTETRRFWAPNHAKKFKPGVEFMGYTDDPRRHGEPIHPARVILCYKELLGDMSDESFEREGGTRYWKNKAEYIEKMGGPNREVYVLRFDHIDTLF